MISNPCKRYAPSKLALFLLVTLYGLSGCLEFQEPILMGNNESWGAPIIRYRNVWPTPRPTPTQINLGNNCLGQEFKIPPLISPDAPAGSQFHYVWLLNHRTIDLPGIIEADAAKNAIISLKIDAERLKSFFPDMTTEEFIAAPMKLELHISNKPYFEPEMAIPLPNALEGYMYWIVSFRELAC